jgi:hypothetical protein
MTALKAGVASVLALAIVAVAPALANAAQPYWTSNGKILKEGQSETVKTAGSVAFTLTGVGASNTIKCKLTDQEVIENPVGGGAGTDLMTAFQLTNCTGKPQPCTTSAITAVVTKLPWATELVAGPPIRDVIKGIEVEFKCTSSGGHVGTYEGELAPEVGASVLTFSPGSGQLEEPPLTGKTATLTGTDKLTGPPGDTKIAAEVVEHEPHWYSNGKRIAENTPETVASKGTLETHSSNGGTLTCKVTDTEIVENPLGGLAGIDEMTAFTYSGCKLAPACPKGDKLLVQAVPGSLPWSSKLLAGPPIRDEISGIAVELKCVGVTPASVTYTGALTPEVGSSALVFGAGSGLLSGSNSTKATVTGTDKLTGPAGDKVITAEDP